MLNQSLNYKWVGMPKFCEENFVGDFFESLKIGYVSGVSPTFRQN